MQLYRHALALEAAGKLDPIYNAIDLLKLNRELLGPPR